MGKNNKRKREPTPPSEEFGDSEYSEEEFSSESEGSPAPVSPPASSDDSDDSQGIAAEVWTYIRAVERASTMGKNNKRKREPTPPSEEFGDSEYSEEEFSSESEGSPAPVSPPASSDDSDDSQGIAAEVWTYIRAVERAGLEGSDESEYSSGEEDSDGGDGSRDSTKGDSSRGSTKGGGGGRGRASA